MSEVDMVTLFYIGRVNQITAAQMCNERRKSPSLMVHETTEQRLSIEGADEEVSFLLRALVFNGYDHTSWSKSFRGEAITEEEYQALRS